MDDMWRELVGEASNAAHNLCAELESVQFGHRDSGPIREWLKDVIGTLNDLPSLYDVIASPPEEVSAWWGGITVEEAMKNASAFAQAVSSKPPY